MKVDVCHEELHGAAFGDFPSFVQVGLGAVGARLGASQEAQPSAGEEGALGGRRGCGFNAESTEVFLGGVVVCGMALNRLGGFKIHPRLAPGDPRALAEATTRLLEPAALKAAHSGAKKAAKALTWKKAAQAHDKLYREVRR